MILRRIISVSEKYLFREIPVSEKYLFRKNLFLKNTCSGKTCF